MLDGKAENLEEEYKIIMEFYKTVFQKIDYNIAEEKLERIVNNFVYDEDDSKYLLYKPFFSLSIFFTTFLVPRK